MTVAASSYQSEGTQAKAEQTSTPSAPIVSSGVRTTLAPMLEAHPPTRARTGASPVERGR
ncbi:hypothetical protein P9139_20650 [Curtobacterium flaccumfaciens]|nr:hypothetical protein P9139_20650 [Curtobacterium flaccumfaciens]